VGKHQSQEVLRPEIETIHVLIRGIDDKIKALDDKFKLMADEAEKRNGQRFDAQQEAVTTAMTAAEKAVSAAMAAAEKAVTKAENASERRFESVNEFRQTLSDQSSSFLTRTEYQVQHKSLEEKIDSINRRAGTTETLVNDIRARGAGRNDIWVILTTVVATMISFAAIALHFFKG